MFGRKPKLLLDLETDPDIRIAGTYKEYYNQLSKRLQYLHKVLHRSKRLCHFSLNKPIENHIQKGKIKYVGLLSVYKIVDPYNYLSITLDGKLLMGLFEHKSLKPAVIRTNQDNMTNISKLTQVMALGILEP